MKALKVLFFFFVKFSMSVITVQLTIDRIRLGNETVEIYNWNNSIDPTEIFYELLTGHNREYMFRQEILKIGCDCSEIFCHDGCCLCQMDCPKIFQLEDKWISRIYGNCSNASITGLTKVSELTSEGGLSILMKKASKRHWLCEESNEFQNNLFHFYRFLCVRSDNLVRLGIFFPDHQERPHAAHLRRLINREFSWSKEQVYDSSKSKPVEVKLVPSRTPYEKDNKIISKNNLNTTDLKNRTSFLIRGSGACSKYKGIYKVGLSAFIPCKVYVKLMDGFSCDVLRSVLDDAAESFVSTALKNGSSQIGLIGQSVIWRETELDEDSQNKMQFDLNICLNVTVGLKITSAQFAAGLLNISIIFVKGSLPYGTTRIPFFVSIKPTGVMSLAQSQASKFFNDHFASMCPEQYCWRDLLKNLWNWRPGVSLDNERQQLRVMSLWACGFITLFSIIRYMIQGPWFL